MIPESSAPIRLVQVLRDPYGVAENLVASDAIYGLVDVDVRIAERSMVCFWLSLEPWSPMAAAGYSIERVAITIDRTGRITAVPVAARNRRWLHQNTPVLGNMRFLGELCLWFPNDPRPLRWEWSNGLVAYITIVHRHLQAEEFWRRNGHWPSEDAPHGDGDHPIRTWPLRRIACQGAT